MKEVQGIWQEVIAKMLRDIDWAETKFGSMVATDPFINELLNIAKNVRKYPHRSKFHLGIVRSDYLFDSLRDRWEQVSIQLFTNLFR